MLERKYWDILYVLSEEDYLPAKIIGDRIGVSEKTIRTRIKELNSILDKFNSEIKSKKGSGFILKVEDKDKLINSIQSESKTILPSDNDDRTKYIFFKLLTTNNYVKIEELSEELFVSKNIISKNIANIEKKIIM